MRNYVRFAVVALLERVMRRAASSIAVSLVPAAAGHAIVGAATR